LSSIYVPPDPLGVKKWGGDMTHLAPIGAPPLMLIKSNVALQDGDCNDRSINRMAQCTHGAERAAVAMKLGQNRTKFLDA